ncbi:hypothetical protein [Alteromonas sp. BMJM2]|nr:hypothetical protein [Alteromonas sp. BMJM2]
MSQRPNMPGFPTTVGGPKLKPLQTHEVFRFNRVFVGISLALYY